MDREDRIPFITEDGEQVIFEVLEQTMVAGANYILVTEDNDLDLDNEDVQAYIMKEIDEPHSEDMLTYQFVEDEQELLSISKIFEQLLEDTDIVSGDI